MVDLAVRRQISEAFIKRSVGKLFISPFQQILHVQLFAQCKKQQAYAQSKLPCGLVPIGILCIDSSKENVVQHIIKLQNGLLLPLFPAFVRPLYNPHRVPCVGRTLRIPHVDDNCFIALRGKKTFGFPRKLALRVNNNH